MTLTQDQKITIGQCFNLAHAEINRDNTSKIEIDNYLITRTKQLYELKNQIIREMDNTKNV